MLLETTKENGVAPERCNEKTKVACATEGGDWDALTVSANQADKDKVKEY